MKKPIFKILFIILFTINSSAVIAGDDGNLEIKKNNGQTEVKDCFEKVNRGIFAFNQVLDKIVFRPLAKGYRLFPQPIRSGTSNALNNLSNLEMINN